MIVGALHDVINEAGAVLGALVALVALNAVAKGFYRRSFGRRRDRYARLARLGTGAQLNFFVAVLGEPPAIRQTITNEHYRVLVRPGEEGYVGSGDEVYEAFVQKAFLEAIFIDRDYYVQAICDTEETVLGFSVTVRRRNFHPVFQLPPDVSWRDRRRWKAQTGEEFKPLFKLRLGRTRFAELDRGHPDEFTGHHFQAATGARGFFYSEDHYYGNPGFYQTFVFTASSTAPVPVSIADLAAGIDQARGNEWPDPTADNQPAWPGLPGIRAFRRKTPITTYSVLRLDLQVVNFPTRFGPHGDEVRTLP